MYRLTGVARRHIPDYLLYWKESPLRGSLQLPPDVLCKMEQGKRRFALCLDLLDQIFYVPPTLTYITLLSLSNIIHAKISIPVEYQ